MHGNAPLMEVSVHESAIVEPGAAIGPGTSIWHFSHVRSGARIGRDCMLAKGTYVGETAWIGDRVRIQNGVSVFNGVKLEDEVFVGPGVIFTNDHYPRAVNLIDPDMRPTRVCRGATLGAGSVIICGIDIGSFAMIGAGSVVTANVVAYARVIGNPARQVGWSCRCGRPLVAAAGSSNIFNCSACARSYRRSGAAPENGHPGCLNDCEKLECVDHDYDA